MKTAVASLFLGLSLMASSSFAETRVYTWIPAQLIMDGLKQSGIAFSNCSQSNNCELNVTNVECLSEVSATNIGTKCSLTDKATGKDLVVKTADVRNKVLKLDQVLTALGYKNHPSQKWTLASVLESISCSSQKTGENAVCYVTEADFVK